MSAVTVQATVDPTRGLFQQTVTTNCDLNSCRALITLTGAGSKNVEVTRLTYQRIDGETHACQKVFCSRKCSRAFVSGR